MFQDFGRGRMDNSFAPCSPREDDLVVAFDKGGVLIAMDDDGVPTFPMASQCHRVSDQPRLLHLLACDGISFFWLDEDFGGQCHESLRRAGFSAQPPASVLHTGDHGGDGGLSFAYATATHLASWYVHNRFCGQCGATMMCSLGERALVCPSCGQTVYPRISPAVIVGVVDGDRILLTRYADRRGYRRHSLVAGFVEVGETLEDTVRREVMEEVGLRVKNIRYWKSQPWAFSESLLTGFFCEPDGDPAVHLNTDGKGELSEGVWLRREQIVAEDTEMSLTWSMIMAFARGEKVM